MLSKSVEIGITCAINMVSPACIISAMEPWGKKRVDAPFILSTDEDVAMVTAALRAITHTPQPDEIDELGGNVATASEMTLNV